MLRMPEPGKGLPGGPLLVSQDGCFLENPLFSRTSGERAAFSRADGWHEILGRLRALL